MSRSVTMTGELVRALVAARYEDIPEAARQIARQVCLDGIAVTIAGLREPLGLGGVALTYTQQLGGTPESTVIGGGFKTSAYNAAYVNGTLCHALDFDNTWWPLNHPTSPTLPAILALAERDGLSGTEVITAIVLAFEVQGRMRVASARVEPGTTFHKPGVSGMMGATTGAGKLLGLDERAFCRAFGIAGSRAGSMSANTGTMTKASHSGHAARMGIESASLAALGWTAHEDIFELGGFFELFYGPGYYDLDLFLKDFGNPYRMIDPGVGFKKYPCNYFTHRPIDAAIELQEKYDLMLKDIAEVEIDFPRVEYVSRPAPKTGLDGKFSVQYTTAAALLDRTITIDTFSDQRRFAPDIEALLPRVRVNIRDDIPKEFQSTWAIVRVRTIAGRTSEVRCDRPRGMWGVPLTREERLAKFRDCVEPALPPADVDRLIELIERLDELPGVEPIMTVAGRAQGLRGE